MANQTVYPYGTGGSLPSSIGIINDLVTGGADKALSAEQGKVINDRFIKIAFTSSSSSNWGTGDIQNNGTINPNYANKYLLVYVGDIAEVVDSITITRATPPDSTYNIKVMASADGITFINTGGNFTGSGTTPVTINITGKRYIGFGMWDKPSTARAQQEVLSISYIKPIVELPDNTFSNPVLSQNCADPCIVDGQDGYFYLYFTGGLGTIAMRRTTNFLDWEVADSPFTTQGVADCLSDLGLSSASMWAPEIVKVGNKYNLYASREATPMVVFQSEHPFFGYEYKGKIITQFNGGLSYDNIDACVRYDLDGTLWMFWGSTYGIYRQKLSADGLSLDSEDTKVHVAGKLLSEDNTRATVFEGAYLYRKGGYWYLFVSAGLYSNYTYCLKVGRSATLNGTFVDKDGNDMADGYATTILSSANGETLYGPGHTGAIFTDRNNRTYMLFHSHDTRAGNSNHRYVCLQEMFWDENGWPYFGNSGKPQLDGNTKPVL